MTMLELLVGGRMRHEKMHNVKRSDTPSQIFYTSRLTLASSSGSAATASITSLATDIQTDPASAFTTVTETFADVITQPGVTVTTTYTSAVAITDSAQYSSILASESTQTPSSASATSNTTASSSSAATSPSSSSDVGTLVPAIIIPVVVVLLASLGLFWFIMRRRHKRQLEDEPEFVMATKPEKPLGRGHSNASGTSSTRELVPMSKTEKEAVLSHTQGRTLSNESSPPKYTNADIGVARPMTPADKARADSNAAGRGNAPAVPNFSSVRPGVNGRTRPSQDFNFSDSNVRTRPQPSPKNQARGRDYGQASRGPPRRGESPFMAGSRGPAPRSHRSSDNGAQSKPRSPVEHQPSPFNTKYHMKDRAGTSKALNPPTPTGAFNGISPISQYSPIIKSTGMNPGQPAAKAGYGGQTSKTVLLMPERQSKADSVPSPELPPPLTREDMPPRLFAQGTNSPAGGSSSYHSPTIGAELYTRSPAGPSQPPLIPHNQSGDRNVEQRLSIISRISSDDEYVDMELDDKSDVSSLDEREKWEVESDRVNSNSRLATGYGSASMSPTDGPNEKDSPNGSGSRLVEKKGGTKSNLRDRDSEGPFVLSRY